MSEPACAACGVPYVDHLGLHGTCAALVEARRLLASAIQERDEACAEVERLRLDLAAKRP